MIERNPQMTVRSVSPPLLLNRMQFLIGILLLVTGSLIYVTDRAPEYIYFTRFFGLHLKMFGPDTRILGAFGLRLPAFFHVLSFSLITAAFMSAAKKQFLGISIGWFLINSIFELGQKYKHAAAGITPEFFDRLPFFENTRAYFLSGTFDWLDIAAAAFGAVAAYLLLLATQKYHFAKSYQTGSSR